MRKVATLGWGIGAICNVLISLVCLVIGKTPSMVIYLGGAGIAGILACISHFKETHWL